MKEIRAGGGGSKNPLWRQMQADVFGRKVATLRVEQGAAYGAALLATVGCGSFDSVEQACEATVHVDSWTNVQRKSAATYDRLFPLYQQLYHNLKDTFAQLG